MFKLAVGQAHEPRHLHSHRTLQMARPNRRSDGRRLRLIGKKAARLAGSGCARSVRAFWQTRNVRSRLQRLSEQTLPGRLVWNAQGDSQTQAAPEMALFAGDMRLVAHLGSFAVLACVGMPGRPLKLLVTQVLSRRTAKLVAATARRSPSELQRHHEKKQVNKEATHRFSVASAVGFATPRMQRSVAGCGLRNRRAVLPVSAVTARASPQPRHQVVTPAIALPVPKKRRQIAVGRGLCQTAIPVAFHDAVNSCAVRPSSNLKLSGCTLTGSTDSPWHQIFRRLRCFGPSDFRAVPEVTKPQHIEHEQGLHLTAHDRLHGLRLFRQGICEG